MKKKIILIGAGGHAKGCIDVIEQGGQYQIVGLVGVEGEEGKEIFGYKVIGSEKILGAMRAEIANAFIAIGQIKSPEARMRVYKSLQEHGYEMPTLVASTAYVSPHAVLGEGTLVMNHATVNAGAVIGANCIINTGAIIEHDAIIDNHCHIATRATVNGGVQIGEGSFIGSGSTLKEYIKIGPRTLVGMGAKARKDISGGTVYVG